MSRVSSRDPVLDNGHDWLFGVQVVQQLGSRWSIEKRAVVECNLELFFHLLIQIYRHVTMHTNGKILAAHFLQPTKHATFAVERRGVKDQGLDQGVRPTVSLFMVIGLSVFVWVFLEGTQMRTRLGGSLGVELGLRVSRYLG
jgi:hypothetical protein